MADKKKKDPPPPPTPPPLDRYVEVGDPVMWYPGGDESADPHAAIVTSGGQQDTIVASVFDASLMGVIPQDGCRHMDDPRIRNDSSGGGWRHKPLTVAVRRLLLENELLAWHEYKPGSFRLVVTWPGDPKPAAAQPAA